MMISGCGQTSQNYSNGMRALEENDYDMALKYFEAAGKIDGEMAEACRGQGIALYELHDYKTAIRLFRSSLSAAKQERADSDFIEDVQYYLADCYNRNGQTDEALSIYQELEKGKNPQYAWLLEGKIYMDQDDTDRAMKYFTRATENCSDYEIYLQIYEACCAKNRQGDGADYLEKALEISPESGSDYYQLGKISYVMKDYDNAAAYLEKAVSENVDGAIELLGRVCLENGDIDAARKAYNKDTENGERTALAYNGLALCDMAEKNYDSALSNIQSGLALNDTTEREELLYNEIIVYERKLDFETAKQKMKEFLKLYPKNEDAVRENTFLETR